jgi:hypothetical protein
MRHGDGVVSVGERSERTEKRLITSGSLQLLSRLGVVTKPTRIWHEEGNIARESF